MTKAGLHPLWLFGRWRASPLRFFKIGCQLLFTYADTRAAVMFETPGFDEAINGCDRTIESFGDLSNAQEN